MSKTLLNGTNEVLKRLGLVSESNLLTSLTNSGKQVFIDLVVQAWNEVIDQIYDLNGEMKPNQGKEGTIVLATGTRTYSLATDLTELKWPLHDETNGNYIYEYPGGYEALRRSQPQPANFTGEATYAAISPIDGKLYLDFIPTASENGDTYKYLYWLETGMSTAASTFPFSDAVFRALVPVVAEQYRLMRNNKFVPGVSKVNFGRAARLLRKQPQRQSWMGRGTDGPMSPLGYDPYEGR